LGTYSEDQKREGSETNHKWMKLRGLKELHSSALTKEEQEDVERNERRNKSHEEGKHNNVCAEKPNRCLCCEMSGGPEGAK
jgi:hypothetical protein